MLQSSFSAPQLPKDQGVDRRLEVRSQLGERGCSNALIFLGEESRSGVVADLSLSGICLILKDPPKPGTVVTAELCNTSRLFHCTRLLRIVHAKPGPGGYHLVGCQFSSPLTYDQFQALVY